MLCDDTTTENAENAEAVPMITEILQSLHHIVLLANVSAPTHTLHSAMHRANAVSIITCYLYMVHMWDFCG